VRCFSNDRLARHLLETILSPLPDMRNFLLLSLSLTWLMLPSCRKKEAAAPPKVPPAAVTFAEVATEKVVITKELPGRIGACRVAEVRARVPGILLRKIFEEGAMVSAGDGLFQIDQAPLLAARNSAAANLARAEAGLQQAENSVKRFRELVAVKAVSKQGADDAESAVSIASAENGAATAALATAELNLGYAFVTAPIAGRIGKAQVTEGALVGQGTPTLLAVIQQLDPIYFDFTQSSSDSVALSRAMGKNADPERAKVSLLLDDGSEYEHPGKLLFSEVTVDETTGMVTLRAEFPNPNKLLLPGMFARARVVQSVEEKATTVPQQAVTRGVGGGGSVMVIDKTNHVQPRQIQTGALVGDKWVVSSGLEPGERVIMEGLLKARPGAEVKPEPFVKKAAGKSAKSAQH
jgi:membrane fusion protein, multidrug efflux system